MVTDVFTIQLARASREREGPRWPEEYVGDDANGLLPGLLKRLDLDGFDGSPLVLFGPAGTGKTSLARTCLHRLAQRLRWDSDRLMELDGADFARAVAQAYETNSVARWRQRFGTVLGVLIDDLQRLAGKEAAQRELRLIIDDVQGRGGVLAVTCRAHPGQTEGIDPALASRLSSGCCLSLQHPGCAARRVLLQRLSTQRQLAMTEPAINCLADQLEGPVYQLSRAVNTLLARRQLDGRPNGDGSKGNAKLEPPANESVTNESAAGASVPNIACIDRPEVEAFLREQEQAPPTLKAIAHRVAKAYRLRVGDLKSQSRKQAIVRARGVAMLLCRRLTPISLERIGQHFGGRDHTTVLHACRKIEGLLSSDSGFQESFAKLADELRAMSA